MRRYFDTRALQVALRNARYRRRGRPKIGLWPIINFGLWHWHWIEGKPIEDLVDRWDHERATSS
jgi:hypothetical protein